ncbi:hypothetical protein [Pelistega ratti]|uniref:hypothetical protein n=1 Tax=Pelistega ratti TaxID=2652177 RepID=UPI001356F636|nr:hypothetical protein [Pelistega ratti]
MLKKLLISTFLFASIPVFAQTADELVNQADNMVDKAEAIWESNNSYMIDSDNFKEVIALYEKAFTLYQRANKQLHLNYPKVKEKELSAKARLYHLVWSGSAKNCSLALSLRNEIIEEQDINAYPHIKAAALNEDGGRYYTGICARQDDYKSLEAYGEACDLGHNQACVWYNMTKNDIRNAEIYLEKCKRGDTFACSSPFLPQNRYRVY